MPSKDAFPDILPGDRVLIVEHQIAVLARVSRGGVLRRDAFRAREIGPRRAAARPGAAGSNLDAVPAG